MLLIQFCCAPVQHGHVVLSKLMERLYAALAIGGPHGCCSLLDFECSMHGVVLLIA
jgi:hypothetical protein